LDLADRRFLSDDAYALDVGTFDLNAPEYVRRPVGTYTGFIEEDYGGSLDTLGLYVSDQLRIGRLQLLAGLRFERFRTQPTGQERARGSAFLPRLGALFKLTPDSSVYASWITGFEPPDPAVNAPRFGGPFDPQDSRLFEIGYKTLAMEGQLLFTAAAYDLQRTNVVVYAFDEDNPDLYRQRGAERARGIEVEASGKVTPRLMLIANYAYNAAIILRDTDPTLIGRTKEGAPRHMGTLWGRYEIGSGVAVGAGLTHVGNRNTFDERLVLPAYTVLNAGFYFDRAPLRLALLVNNVTDKLHYTGGYNFGRTFPGSPRTVQFSASARF
jgi:iron complex outermembrane receptor protein